MQMLLRHIEIPPQARKVYHQSFVSTSFINNVQKNLVIAAMVAQWNACPFCIDTHGSIAALELGKSLVKSVLEDFQRADISGNLQLTLGFLEKLIRPPDNLSTNDAQTGLCIWKNNLKGCL